MRAWRIMWQLGGSHPLPAAPQVAALTDNDAHMALLEGDAYTLDTKPHGHGDVHTLLASTGLASKWDAEGAWDSGVWG